MFENRPPRQYRVVRLTWTTAVWVVAVIIGFAVLRGAFVAASRVVSWAVAAAIAAVVVEPVTTWMARFVPRVLAVLFTIGVIGGLVATVIIGSVDDLDSEVDRLQATMPDAIAELEARDDEVGRIATEIGLTARSEAFLDALDDRVGSASEAVVDNASALPVYFVSAILTVFLLVYGPRIAQGALGQVPGRFRPAVIADVVQRAVGQARHTLTALVAQGLVIGVATLAVAEALDLPAPVVLALIATVLSVLPDVGIVMGVFPTVALTAALEGVTVAAVMMVVVLAVQVFEGVSVRRWVRGVGVDVGPSVIWIVGLVGFTIYGPGMAFYGVVLAIFALAIVDQVPETRRAFDEQPPGRGPTPTVR